MLFYDILIYFIRVRLQYIIFCLLYIRYQSFPLLFSITLDSRQLTMSTAEIAGSESGIGSSDNTSRLNRGERNDISHLSGSSLYLYA